MPPPIQTQNSSRAALVTWTVVSSILFVIATVLAIFSTVARNRAEQERQSLQQRYERVVAEADLSGDLVGGLDTAKKANPQAYPGNLLSVALSQRDTLARRLAGGGVDEAMTRADDTIKQVKADKALGVSGDNLNAVVGSLRTTVKGRDGQIAQLTAARDDLAKKLKNVNDAAAGQMAALKTDLDKANAAQQAAQAQVEAYRTEKDEAFKAANTEAEKNFAVATETVNQQSATLQEANANAKRKDDQIKALQNKLRETRQPVDQITRQADAHVMRLGGDNILYVDLGTNDQVSAGMTFEIYDRIGGIPKPGDPNNEEAALPKGKASIEIIKVSPGSSECRVVRQTPGETVVEGDIVVNAVYDRNVKYNFMVYGSFDLDRNGQATPQDADVIKRLVTRWGGRVTAKLSADTDFLVIGKLPEIPSYTQEELDRPEIQFALEQRKKELAEYDDLLAQATALNIPVLNQNRFLYFTGYYEQSAR